MSGHVRHSQVEQQDFGLILLHQGEGFGAVASFAHHLELVIGKQHVAQPHPHYRMVVGNEKADWVGISHWRSLDYAPSGTTRGPSLFSSSS